MRLIRYTSRRFSPRTADYTLPEKAARKSARRIHLTPASEQRGRKEEPAGPEGDRR